MLFLSTCGYSQIKGYTFAQSNVVYPSISGGTSLGDSASDTQYFLDATTVKGTTGLTGAGIPIGFNFTFNGQVYDRFGIANDGWIALGSSTLGTKAVDMKVDKFGTAPLPLSSVTAMTNELNAARIAALSADLQGQSGSAIRFATTGANGSKELIIQWENYKRTGVNASGDSFNFQIRLMETSNTIQISYGDFITNQTFSDVFQKKHH